MRKFRLERHLVVFSVAGILSIIIAPHTPAQVQEQSAPTWQFTLEPNKTIRSSITVVNRCQQPHHFHITTPAADYVRIELSSDGLTLAPGGQQQVAIRFDSTRTSAGIHSSYVDVICTDCSQEIGCAQDRDRFVVEMTVADASRPDLTTSQAAPPAANVNYYPPLIDEETGTGTYFAEEAPKAKKCGFFCKLWGKKVEVNHDDISVSPDGEQCVLHYFVTEYRFWSTSGPEAKTHAIECPE